MDSSSDKTKHLVTGAAGFMGSHVARELLAMGHEVVALDDLSGGFIENVPDGAVFVKGSVLDEALIDRLFEENRFERVYHLAAYAAEGLSHFIRRFNYENNLVGTVNLINASVRTSVRVFVFTSSIAVYGDQPTPMRESMTPAPKDPYGISKYAAELDLAAAKEMWGLEHVIFRPHNVFGEGQNIGDPYRNVIGIFMNQIMSGRPLTIFGDGEQTRAFSYIGEVAPWIARAPDIPGALGEVFNLGADRAVSLNELAALIGEIWKVEPRIEHLPARLEAVHAVSDHSKIREVFPPPDRPWPLREGLERMSAWARERGAVRGELFDELEVDRNLPEIWRKRK